MATAWICRLKSIIEWAPTRHATLAATAGSTARPNSPTCWIYAFNKDPHKVVDVVGATSKARCLQGTPTNAFCIAGVPCKQPQLGRSCDDLCAYALDEAGDVLTGGHGAQDGGVAA